LKKAANLTKYTFKEHPEFTHGTNAQELIERVPAIEVEDDVALCFVEN
jgi:hypothetical protein